MNTYANRPQDKESHPVALRSSEQPRNREVSLAFDDNRPEALAQRKLQDAAHNSPLTAQLEQIQAIANRTTAQHDQPPPNRTHNGLPAMLKSAIEHLSGYSMDDVTVHYNSEKPAALQAHAYAQGTDIHLSPGQEKYLPHEAWHVVQQKQGRVKPTVQLKNQVKVNDDLGLEQEADIMGARALQMKLDAVFEKQLYVGNTIQTKRMSPIQFAPPGLFTALAPRQPGTMIPTDHNGWIKPRWLRGAPNGAMSMRNALLASKKPELEVEGQKFYRCCLCGKLADSNGMAVDHATDWKEWCESKGSADLQQLEYNFHDLDNLHVTHTNCNSSKSQDDLFDWWQSEKAVPYMDEKILEKVRDTMDRIFLIYGIDWLYEIPMQKRIKVVDAIIEDALSKNVFQKLMANAKLADQLGWSVPEPKGGDDDDDPMSDEAL